MFYRMCHSRSTTATTLVCLHNQYHGPNAETSPVKSPSQSRKTKRQSVLDERVRDKVTTKKRKEYVTRETHTLTAEQWKLNKENVQ